MQLLADFLSSSSTKTWFSPVPKLIFCHNSLYLNPHKVELATETDNPPDSSHLRNSFTSDWKPKTIDDYISAYLGGLVSSEVFQFLYLYHEKKLKKLDEKSIQ